MTNDPVACALAGVPVWNVVRGLVLGAASRTIFRTIDTLYARASAFDGTARGNNDGGIGRVIDLHEWDSEIDGDGGGGSSHAYSCGWWGN